MIKLKALVNVNFEYEDGSVEEAQYNGVLGIRYEWLDDRVYDSIYDIVEYGELVDVDCDDNELKQAIIKEAKERGDFEYYDDMPTITVFVKAKDVGLE